MLYRKRNIEGLNKKNVATVCNNQLPFQLHEIQTHITAHARPWTNKISRVAYMNIIVDLDKLRRKFQKSDRIEFGISTQKLESNLCKNILPKKSLQKALEKRRIF